MALVTGEQKIRVLVAKPGLDGHDRGAKVIARALRDAGMEVIYTGLRQTPEMVVSAALQEDVDVIGLSIERLTQAGVAGIFQPGTAMDDIVKFIRENVKPRGVPAG